MFNSCEFVYDGESSCQYDLMLYDFGGNGQNDVPFGTQASIVETKVNRRIQPIHFGVKYNESPLSFKLVFGTERYLDRYELERVSMWLMGRQDYCWLSINQPDLDHVQFKAIFTQITPISHAWLPVAFEASVVCDCAYAYGFPFEYEYDISGETGILFYNESSSREYFKPTMEFTSGSGTTDLSIVNHNDNDREFKLKNIPGEDTVLIDNNSGIIKDMTTTSINLYGGFNGNFLRLVSGDNELTVTGSGTLKIYGRFLHNVAG